MLHCTKGPLQAALYYVIYGFLHYVTSTGNLMKIETQGDSTEETFLITMVTITGFFGDVLHEIIYVLEQICLPWVHLQMLPLYGNKKLQTFLFIISKANMWCSCSEKQID